ncbi:c-type cytochrome [Paracoccus rhizosphaerae]|uniref:C-type cytochrome n=1 Tax=Paracoccus rhizosphaerae TaxID=1133347 RepID=A0ABV6CJ67_9RHOB|nr:cytochrome c [Paracoccus rhizosphaerae]
MMSFCRAAVVAALSLAGSAAQAQTATGGGLAEEGRSLAQTCRVCHGLDGVGTNPMIPNIGGQSAEYLSKQLQDFRAGRREDPQMSIIARDLTDEDIASLAAWYASIVATYDMPD